MKRCEPQSTPKPRSASPSSARCHTALTTLAGGSEVEVALERLLEEPELAERLSLQARQKVEEFDWERVKLRWKKVFNSTNL